MSRSRHSARNARIPKGRAVSQRAKLNLCEILASHQELSSKYEGRISNAGRRRPSMERDWTLITRSLGFSSENQASDTIVFGERDKLDPGIGEDNDATVVVVGMPFSGKSSLGNILAFGDPTSTGGFPVNAGLDSSLTTCEIRTTTWEGCMLKVIDTPRVPNRNLHTSLEMFDEIVTAIRRLPSVTALVFVQSMQRYEEHDYRACRVLLRQFSKFPCPIIMVCMVDTSGCPEHVKRSKEESAMGLLQKTADKCDLGSRLEHKYLYIRGEDARGDMKELRRLLLSMPKISMPEGAIATYAEVEKRLSRLSNENECLKDQLGEDISYLQNLIRALPSRFLVLNSSIESRKKWLNIVRRLGAPLDRISRCLPSDSESVQSSKPKLSLLGRMKETTEVEMELALRDLEFKKKAEFHGLPPEELLRAREEYDELRGLGAGAF